MTIGVKGAQNAAKTLSLTAIELFENSDLRARARREHEESLSSDFHYEALLGDRPPPLDYRN
jgi:aminobenzoyl-glutamate utilization protein B